MVFVSLACECALATAARVTVRAWQKTSTAPCAMDSATGFKTPTAIKLHGPVWLPQRHSDFTVLV
ncbi:hypothetical protein SM757_02030 (plasmid) [Azohydromonas lata]|uniref:Secreted protein n=1 Tax=Azohydromonas lata TaxID=45677 RepID=A0ABU5I8C8_9BURK|nr:hypothetical protein [Azohydromonas lata]